MILLIKLILAHLIGDFVLQPNSWVKEKEKNKLRSIKLYLHALLHGVLVLLIVSDWGFLSWALLVTIVHLIIDSVKLICQKAETQRKWFFIDQSAHLLSLYLIFNLYNGYTDIDYNLFNEGTIMFITCIMFLSTLAVHTTRMFIARWVTDTEDTDEDSLNEAGKYIGILERLFAFGFVITDNWEALGFLLAAKSIFRFGDLKAPKERKLTEYILIGTLLSFGIAIFTGVIFKLFLKINGIEFDLIN